MCWMPSAPGAGTKSTWQLATPVETVVRLQLEGEKPPPPATSVAQVLTLPVGVVAVPKSVSDTVAVHRVAALTGSELGVQLTTVALLRWVTVKAKLFELLVR
jgi:hypothetical protein